MNTGQILEALNDKADRDIQNLDNIGKSLAAGFPMPSGSYTDLTLGTSGATYTAPSDGYFCFAGTTSVNLGAIILADQTTGFYAPMSRAQTSATIGTYLPIKKGNEMAIAYDGISSVVLFRFYYAEGTKQEAN